MDTRTTARWLARWRRARSLLLVVAALMLVASSCADSRPPAEVAAPAALGEFFEVGRGLRAEHRGQGLRADLDERGAVRFAARAGSAELSLSGLGRGEAVQAAPPVSAGPSAAASRATYRRGPAVEEWYESVPRGVEQGFVLAEPPAVGRAGDPLVLRVRVTGLRPAEGDRPGELALRDDGGRAVLHYSDLSARDAAGRALPSSMRAAGADIVLSIDDRGARYPVTIDPLVWVQLGKMTQTALGTLQDQLGTTLSLSGETALVGASGSDEEGVDAGAAYVFIRSGATWVQQAKLVPAGLHAGDHFGHAVSLSGDVAIVGAHGDDAAGGEAGAAYVFVRSGTTWTEQRKITPPAGSDGAYFGVSVALSGDTAIVGAYGEDDQGSLAGAAHVLGKDVGGAGNWGEVTKLLASDGAAQDNFGIAVTLDQSTAVIGARGADANGSLSGAAYVFVRTGTTWTQQAKLLASDGAALDELGSSVSVKGDTAVVGAFLANAPTADSGAAYVFVRTGTTWTQQAKLVAADPDVQDFFGSAVAVSGDRVVVGAFGDDEKAADAGAVYLFTRSGVTWTQAKKIMASDGAGSDAFGTAVALEGTRALVGSPNDDDTGANSGSGYVLDKDQTAVDAWGETSKLRALDGLLAEDLGYAVAVAGDTVIAGAYGANDLGAETGAAYVFVRGATGWSEQQRLVAADGAASDRFGFTVAISGDTAVVGAYQHDGAAADVGAAYVFVRSAGVWTQQQKLVAADAAASDFFGVAVAISGDTVLVGAHGDDDKGSASGSVYVFTRTGAAWTQQQKLVAADGAANDNFGRALALHADTAVVGSPNDDDTAANSGAAYVFLRTGTTWAQQAKLVASDPVAADAFGFSVAVNADTAVIGAYLKDVGTVVDQGAAYAFVRTGTAWAQQARLVAADGETTDRFGVTVAVSGDRAVIGALNDDDKGNNAGAAYVFVRAGTAWAQDTKLTGADTAGGDLFGCAVAYDGTTAAIGAYGDDDKGSASGATYAFEIRKTDGTTCGGDAECQSGHCIDTVCCAASACPSCFSCGLAGSLGTCAVDAAKAGTSCGDKSSTDCSAPDTCDAAGVCQPNHEATGAACGDTKVTACSGADTCDGAGTCLANHTPAGTACGDSAATACTQPDTCNGAGVCLDNDLADGTACTGGHCAAGACKTEGPDGGTGGAGGSTGTTTTTGSGGQGTGGAGGSGTEDEGGCGCEAAGSPSGGAGSAAALALMIGIALRRRRRGASAGPFVASRAALAAAGMAAAAALAASCGGSGTTSTSSTSHGGHGGTTGGGATGGAGGDACPAERACGLGCCAVGQVCAEGACAVACPADQPRCGDGVGVCCASGEECLAGACAAACPAPRVRCGAQSVCCAGGEVCFNEACTAAGAHCQNLADCQTGEYCETLLGVCLSTGTLPDCTYHPPEGSFSPIKEWTYSPVTAPYVRSSAAKAATDVCAQGGAPIAFADADESLAVVSLGGLVIPFFDKDRTALTVSTNGWLTLDAAYHGGPAPQNPALPGAPGPDTVVAPYWDDLTHVTACAKVDAANKRVTVQWRGEVKGTGEWVRFQATLGAKGGADAGLVELAYLALGATQDGDGATVGVAENLTRRGVQHSRDRNGSVTVGTALQHRYVPLHNRFDALTPPAVFDLDGDGKPEVIFPPYDDTPTSGSTMPNDPINGLHSGVLTILNGEDGTIQVRPLETPGYDGYLGAGVTLSIADLDGDGVAEIIGVGRLEPMVASPPYIKAFKRDGTLLWVSNQPISFNHDGWGGGVHVADLDGDGKPEIFFGLDVFDNRGNLLWSHPVEYGSPTTTAADLDGDGKLEVISDHSVYRWDGSPFWARPDLASYHFPAVADFDLDGKPEVALVGNGSVIILDGRDGTTFWGPISLQTGGGGPLNIGDFDGDGRPELGTAGEGLYLVLDLQCTGTPLPPECDREGVRWSSPTKDFSSNVTGSSLFDFEGDGVAEVIYSDECFTRVYHGREGTILFESPNNTRTATEYPLVADVDGDNNAEIIVVSNEAVDSCQLAPWRNGLLGTNWVQADYPAPFCGPPNVCGYRGITVYGDALDNWVRTRPLWSGHGYHITNVLATGAIPTQEAANWTQPGYNNYRMNAQGAGVFNAPDLKVALLADPGSCPTKVRLRADVSNAGAIGVSTGVPVAFFRQTTAGWQCLGVVQTAKDLLPGAHTEVTLDYTLAGGEVETSLPFKVSVDSDCNGKGSNNECENGGEANNDGFATGFCHNVTPQ